MQMFIICIELNNRPFALACTALRTLKIQCPNKYIAERT